MSVTNFRRASLKNGLPKSSEFGDIPFTTPTPSPVTAGLVRWYDAGNSLSYPTSGSTWTDLQASGYNLTLTNSPTYTNNGSGSYFTFDGSNDYAVGDDTGLPATDAARSFTFWSYRLTATDFMQMWYYGTGGSQQGVFVFQTAASQYSIDTYGATVGGVYQSYPQDVWTMLSFTYAGGTSGSYAYYLNNNSVATGTTSVFNTTLIGTNGLNLGKAAPFGSSYYNGRIAQLMIYNTALTSTDILQNYNAQKGAYGL
jgi:hypothetical protein